jgi:hypothetical protein
LRPRATSRVTLTLRLQRRQSSRIALREGGKVDRGQIKQIAINETQRQIPLLSERVLRQRAPDR